MAIYTYKIILHRNIWRRRTVRFVEISAHQNYFVCVCESFVDNHTKVLLKSSALSIHVATWSQSFQNYTLESFFEQLRFWKRWLKVDIIPKQREKDGFSNPSTLAWLSLYTCPLFLSQPLIQSHTYFSSHLLMFSSESPSSPLAVFIFRLIYTPTHRQSHFLFNLILLSVFIYLFYPVLSLSDFINTPSCSPLLSSFIVGFSLLQTPLPHLHSHPIDG